MSEPQEFSEKSGQISSVRDTLTTCQVPPKIAKFEKISYNEFKNSMQKLYPSLRENAIQRTYDEIILPTRATSGSAGYDIKTPVPFRLAGGQEITIPTGLRCQMADGWVMLIAPRSGLGFKYYTRLANVIGIIDSDYAYADNEGHIMIKMRCDHNDPDKVLLCHEGQAIAQALFVPFGITTDDCADGIRKGGFGSTDGASVTKTI